MDLGVEYGREPTIESGVIRMGTPSGHEFVGKLVKAKTGMYQDWVGEAVAGGQLKVTVKFTSWLRVQYSPTQVEVVPDGTKTGKPENPQQTTHIARCFRTKRQIVHAKHYMFETHEKSKAKIVCEGYEEQPTPSEATAQAVDAAVKKYVSEKDAESLYRLLALVWEQSYDSCVDGALTREGSPYHGVLSGHYGYEFPDAEGVTDDPGTLNETARSVHTATSAGGYL